jgi:hypothetical protein
VDEKPNPTSDSVKLLQLSIGRKAAEASAQKLSPPSSQAKVDHRPVSPPEAAPPSPISTPTSRVARMKKLKNRRDRITVVQNPSKTQYPSPAKSPMLPATTYKVESPTASETTLPTKSSKPVVATSPINSPKHASPSPKKPSPQQSSASRPDRQRVSGGAAAKLLGPVPKEDDVQEKGSYESTEKGSSAGVDAKFSLDIDEYSYASEEFDSMRKQALEEYDIGPGENRRYRFYESMDTEDKDDVGSEATLPSILDRSEVFHENASAAILALLNPRGGRKDAGSFMSGFSATSGFSSTFSPRSVPVPGASALSPPRYSQQSPKVGKEVSAVSALDSPHVVHTKVPNQPLLNMTAEQKLEIMKEKMIDPSKTLADLLTAIATPPEGEEMDQGYMVRRKNACGAVKVLAATPANRKTLAWTVGVLPALASVLHDGGEGKLEEAFPDARVRDEYVEARKRAVSSLLSLCLLKDNRIPIFHCLNLVHGLAKTILQDTEESRQGCSAILGYLSKTPENRLLLVRVPGILDAINSAIKPLSPADSPRKKKYIWDLSDTDDTFSTSSGGRINSNTTGEFTTTTGGGTATTGDFESTTEYANINDDDSDLTPQMTTSPTSLASKAHMTSPTCLAPTRDYLYDNDPNKFVHSTRQNIFATLLHVVKEKDNAVSELCRQFLLLHGESSHVLASLIFKSTILRDIPTSYLRWLMCRTCLRAHRTFMPSRSFAI